METLDIIYKKIPKNFIKYCIAGSTGAIIQIALTTFMVRSTVYYLYASTIAYLLSLISTFLIQKHWTFKKINTHHDFGVMSALYALLSILGLGLNAIILFFLTHLFNLNIFPAQTITTLVVAFISFILNSKITFKEKK